MKAIKNDFLELQKVLASNDVNWQRIIYDRLGVLLLLKKTPILFSNCGYIDLDFDVEYRYVSGVDKTEYIEIHSIEDMIEYISNMPSYYKYLKDVAYDKYTKSELFWAICSRVIYAPQNLELSLPVENVLYGLNTISEYNGELELDISVVDRDTGIISLPLGLTLNETLNLLVKQLNDCAIELGEPIYANRTENNVCVPSSYDDVLKKLESNAEFGWLL